MLEKANKLAQRAQEINRRLKKAYPKAHCALNHSSPLELLIATILSAQCTDERVNRVTASLFRKYRTCEDYIQVYPQELEQDIRPTGFFRTKAKSIQGACRMLLEKHGGHIPKTMEEMIMLPGVARKTANVVLGVAAGIPSGVVVDTHVGRLASTIGLTRDERPERVEASYVSSSQKRVDHFFSSNDLKWPTNMHRQKAPMPCLYDCRYLPLCSIGDPTIE